MFFIIMLVTILGVFFYSTLRLWQMIPSESVLRTLLIVAASFALIAFIVGNIGGGSLPVKLISWLYRFGASWFFSALFMTMIFFVLDIIRATNLTPINQFMHQNWLGFGVFVALMALLMGGGYLNYRNKKRSEITIEIDKPIKGGSMKIVFLSDLHLGYNIGKGEFQQWIKLINREEPDLVLFGGDVIDQSLRPLNEGNFAESFNKIKSKYGVYTILGNHEYISGVNGSIDFFNQTEMVILRDSTVNIAGIQLIGRDDLYSSRRKELSDLTSELNPELPMILIDHQPTALNEAEECGVDLQLSGHTHKGQIFPGNLITKAIFELAYGELQRGSTHYYVSSGMGVWGGKFRIASRSEYVVINLKSRL